MSTSPFPNRKRNRVPFYARVLIFFTLLACLDFAIGSLLRHYYYSQNSGWLYRTTYSLEKTTANVLVFGSSTANHHYYPRLFEKELKMSFYNTGRDGNAIFYQYAVLKGVLKRYTPKIVILDFNNNEFSNSQEGYERISSLLPYYYTHPELRPIILLKSPYEKYKLWSKIYPYNSLLFQIAAGNSSLNESRENRGDEDGYVPLHRVWRAPALRVHDDPPQNGLDSNRVAYYKSFIEACLEKHIRLYIFLSPRFIRTTRIDASVEIGKQIAAGYGVPFFDFSRNPIFLRDPSMYADESHLNDFGARIYSAEVISAIQQPSKYNDDK